MFVVCASGMTFRTRLNFTMNCGIGGGLTAELEGPIPKRSLARHAGSKLTDTFAPQTSKGISVKFRLDPERTETRSLLAPFFCNILNYGATLTQPRPVLLWICHRNQHEGSAQETIALSPELRGGALDAKLLDDFHFRAPINLILQPLSAPAGHPSDSFLSWGDTQRSLECHRAHTKVPLV